MEKIGFQHDMATGESCIGCGDEVLLVPADDGSTSVQCGCFSAAVLVAV